MADIFYSKTVTIFNSVSDDDVMGADSWLPTVLHDVRLLETQGKNIEKSGITSADSAKLFIKTDNLEKPYMDPKEWSQSENKSDAFTLCKDRDFFIVGDVSDETVASFEQMKEKYDGCYQITTVDKYSLIPHFEVGGR